MNTLKNNDNREAAIDIIKFVAMIMVLGLHQQFGRKDNCLTTQFIASACGIAMPLFFMVNGYLMTLRKIDYLYVVRKIYYILRFIFFIGIIYWFFFHARIGEYSLTLMLKNDVLSLLQKGEMGCFWFFGAMIILYLMMPIINGLTNKYRAFLLSALTTLLVIQFVVFIMNIKYQFEGKIIYTFCLWNWLYYYLIGAAIKRYLIYIKLKVSICSVLLLGIVYVWFIGETYDLVMVRGRYFGAVICTVYALVLFIALLQKVPKMNTFSRKVSSLFLPVYALHSIYFIIYYHFINTSFMKEFSPVFDFMIHITILTVGSYWLMKIPYMNKLFKI